jgi:alpha-D-xyloside xylohydrolase
MYSAITFNWDESEKKLTLGDREGSFPGMLKERTFNIVLVTSENGTGMDFANSYDEEIIYQGNKIEVSFDN